MAIMLRDTTKDREYYTASIEKLITHSVEVEENIRTKTHGNTPDLCVWLQSNYLKTGDLMYSRGDEAIELLPFIEKALDLQTLKMHYYYIKKLSFHHVMKEETTDDYPEFKKAYASQATLEAYYSILVTLSKALLLNVNTGLFRKYAWDRRTRQKN